MALPSSGPISIAQINAEIASVNTYSLRGLSSAAGFGTPDSMSEFRGYSFAAFVYYSGRGSTGTGLNSSNPYQVTLLSRGDGNFSSEYGDHVGRATFSGTRSVNFRLSDGGLQTTAYVYGSRGPGGPWTFLRVSFGNDSFFDWNSSTYPFFLMQMDIQRGRENTVYSRTLSLWLR